MSATIHPISPTRSANASVPFETELADGEHQRLHNAMGWSVKAISGALWVTQDGDVRDIVLEAGQSFVLDRPGTVVVSAIGKATMRLRDLTQGCESMCLAEVFSDMQCQPVRQAAA